ncbi:hypothetical protein SD457_05985 [Coprobacillaceae bacterium CR2/5/TPMF4]|nr:hypothetical protein SD457_05985 [Coprobacillaceae bacterium CR2/5/TPMF4]
MNVYVLLDSDKTTVLSICSSYQSGYTETALKEPTVDLSRLAGYKVVDDYLEFDEDKYNDYILEQTKKTSHYCWRNYDERVISCHSAC